MKKLRCTELLIQKLKMNSDKSNQLKVLMSELGIVGSKNIHNKVNDMFVKNFMSNALSGRVDPFTNIMIQQMSPMYTIFDIKNFLFRCFDLEIICDEHNSYIQNAYGFRSKNFIKDEDLLVAGCSVTYGLGVPEEHTWGSIIAKNNNISTSNLGNPGDSVDGIVSNLFAYFKIFGNPKNLFCLFPDFNRMRLPINSDWFELEDDRILHYPYWKFKTLNFGEMPDKKYFKRPFPASEIIPNDIPFSQSVSAIHYLEEYCRSNNINLKWATWDYRAQEIVSLSEAFNNFIEIDGHFCHFPPSPRLPHINFNKCHTELEEEAGMYFISGSDTKMGGNGHPGVHSQIHIAETFEKFLVK